MAALLSDADVGFGPKLLSDADVGFMGPGSLWTNSPPQSPGAATFTEYGPSASAAPTAASSPAPGDTAVERIGEAAAQGFSDTRSVLTPETQQAINNYGGMVGQTLINPAIQLAADVVPGPWNPTQNAAMAAFSKAAMELFGEKGGRDVIGIASSLPVAQGELMNGRLSGTRPTPSTLQGPELRTALPPAVDPITGAPVDLMPLHRAVDLINHDIAETSIRAADAGVANQSIADIGNAQNIGEAIAAAGRAAQGYTPVTATQVAARDNVPIMEAWNRARVENAAGGVSQDSTAAVGVPGIYGGAPDVTKGPFEPAASPAATELAGPIPGAPDADAAPIPQSVGAAASRDMTAPSLADISTADMKANRRRAEMDELLAPPQANDTMIHVPGSFPTLAEHSGDPVLSQYENLLRQRNPGEFIGEGKRLTENNKARVNEYDNNTIPDPALVTMRAKRAAQWVADSKGILPTAKLIDFTPAHDWVMEQLSDPMIQENDAVRGVLENFADRLTDDGGDLKTNPAAAWGIHNNLQNQLAKAKDPLNMTSAEKFAESQILEAKRLVDNALNLATDNRFQLALDNYAEASKAINAGMIFNDFRSKLTNMSGELQAQRFHQLVVNLAKERGDPGIDPSMDISDQGMRSMINIDTDLKRAGLIRLGSAAGSPTNLLGALTEKAGLDAAHSVLGAVPYVGPVLNAVPKYLALRKLINDTAKHLAPPEGGYVYPGGP